MAWAVRQVRSVQKRQQQTVPPAVWLEWEALKKKSGSELPHSKRSFLQGQLFWEAKESQEKPCLHLTWSSAEAGTSRVRRCARGRCRRSRRRSTRRRAWDGRGGGCLRGLRLQGAGLALLGGRR